MYGNSIPLRKKWHINKPHQSKTESSWENDMVSMISTSEK